MLPRPDLLPDLLRVYGYEHALFLDFETYNELDLRKVGLRKYTEHSSLQPTLLSYALDNESPRLWDYSVDPSGAEDAMRWIRDGTVLLVAFNAEFERAVLNTAYALSLPPERFLCVQAFSYLFAFAGSLEKVGEQVGLPVDKAKITAGKNLIRKFCAPRKPSKAYQHTRNNPKDFDDLWQAFRGYCLRDTEAEREILLRLLPAALKRDDLLLRQREYCADARMNERGVAVDTGMVRNAIRFAEDTKDRLTSRLSDITGVENPNSQPQLLRWIRENESPDLTGLSKEVLAEEISREGLSGRYKEVLSLRQQLAKTSVTKYEAFARREHGGRVHGMHQIFGASRTIRDASRGLNLQNIPRGSDIKAPEFAGDLLSNGLFEELEVFFPCNSASSLLSGLIRGVISPGRGKTLFAADLHAIETNVTAELSGSKRLKRIFKERLDPYKFYYSEAFGVPYEDVTPLQRFRAKPPMLACGFAMSPLGFDGNGGLKGYAKNQMGLDLTDDECRHGVYTYREMFHEVQEMWEWLDMGGLYIVSEPPGEVLTGYHLELSRDEDFFYIRLPSGNALCYYRPRIEWYEYPKRPEEAKASGRWTVTYEGISRDNDLGGKWERKPLKRQIMIENAVQATARALFWHGALRALDDSLPLVLRVHDELLGEAHEDEAEELLARLRAHMETPPSWLPDIPLSTSGFISRRYRKD